MLYTRNELYDATRMNKLADKILLLMEQEGLNQNEAELMPKLLEEELSKNSKMLDRAKQFTVYTPRRT